MDNARFLHLAAQKSVMLRAAKIAGIVGIVLAIINHGDTVMTGTLTASDVLKIALTFFVPYCVSTYSSVQAIRERLQLVHARPKRLGTCGADRNGADFGA